MQMPRGVPVQTVNKALHILVMLNKNGPMRAAHIRSALEIPYTTTGRLLQTLELDGVIERSAEDKRYAIKSISAWEQRFGHIWRNCR